MPDVDSTAIRYVGYDEEQARLTVTFMTGRTYRYDRVPAGLVGDFLAAESKGAFFNDKIRDRFPTRLIRGR
jgi:hypothetical protein